MERLWIGKNDNRLYKAYSVNFTPSKEANGYQSSTKPKFSDIKEDLYFYEYSTNSYQELPNSKNKIFKLLFDKELKEYAKLNNLDPSDENDLIALLNKFYGE